MVRQSDGNFGSSGDRSLHLGEVERLFWGRGNEYVLKAHTFSMCGNEEKGDKLGVNSRLPGGCSGWRLRLSKAQFN